MIIDSEYLSLHHKLFTRRKHHIFNFLNGQVLNYYFVSVRQSYTKKYSIPEQNQNSKFEINKVIFKLLSIKIVKNYRYYLITIPILSLSNTYDYLNYRSNFQKSTDYTQINFKKGNNFIIETFKSLIKKNFKNYYLFHHANINLPFSIFGQAKYANSKGVQVKAVYKNLIHEISCKTFRERKKKIQVSPFNFFKEDKTSVDCLTVAISLFNPICSKNFNDTSLIYIRQMKKFRFGIIFLAYDCLTNKKKLMQIALNLYLSIFRIYFMRKKKNKLNAIFMASSSMQQLNIILTTLISNHRDLPYAEYFNAINKKETKNLTTNFLLSEPQQRVLLINIFTYTYFSSHNSSIDQVKYNPFIAKPLITKIPLTFHYLLNDNNFLKESPEKKQLFINDYSKKLLWPNKQLFFFLEKKKKDSKIILFNFNIPYFYNQNEDILINVNFNIYKIVNNIVTLPVLKEFNNDLAYAHDNYFKSNDFIINLIKKCGNIPCSILLIYINLHYRFLTQDLSFFYLNKFFCSCLQNNQKNTNKNAIISFLNYFINIKWKQFIYRKQIILLYGSKKILAVKKVDVLAGTSALNKIYSVKQYKKKKLLLNLYLWDLNTSFFEKEILILKYLNFCISKKNNVIENKTLYYLKTMPTIFFTASAYKKKINYLKIEEKSISRGLYYQDSICKIVPQIKLNNFQIQNRQIAIKKKYISFLPLELKINNMWRSDCNYNYNLQYFSIKRLICFSLLGLGRFFLGGAQELEDSPWPKIKKLSRISFSYLLYSIKMFSNFLIPIGIGMRILQEKTKPLFEIELKKKKKLKLNFFKIFFSKEASCPRTVKQFLTQNKKKSFLFMAKDCLIVPGRSPKKNYKIIPGQANLICVNVKSTLRWYINLINDSFLYKKKINTFLWHSNKKVHNQNSLNWIFKKFWLRIYFYLGPRTVLQLRPNKNKINRNRLNINLFLFRSKDCLTVTPKIKNASHNNLKYSYSSNNWIPYLNKGFDYMIEKKILKLVDIITLDKMTNFRSKYYKQDFKKIKNLVFILGQGLSSSSWASPKKKLSWPSIWPRTLLQFLPGTLNKKNNQQIKITNILFFKNTLTINYYSSVNLLKIKNSLLKNKDSYCLDKIVPEQKKKLNTYFLYL